MPLMETAEQRRERLRALREQAALADRDASEPAQPKSESDQPVLKFRNYAVKDKKIEHTVIEPAHAPEFEEPTAEPPETVPPEVIA
jgi:cwf18 pre-mRNA splicing factor